FVSAILGIGITHLFRHFVHRRRWLTLGTGAALRFAVSSSALAVTHVVLLLGAFSVLLLDPYPPGMPFVLGTVAAILRWTLVFGVWCSIYLVVNLLRQRQEAELHRLRLEKALQVSELRALRSQLNPHFLFNSLNSVRALIAEEPKRAQDAVTQL